MERQAMDLAHFLVNRLQATPPSARLLVGLFGIPASGKSSLAKVIVDNVNAILRGADRLSKDAQDTVDVSNNNSNAVLVGLDGWHFTRAQLDSFQDPKLAHDRRGIHWTFDAASYVAFVQLLRENLTATTPTITAPSFDHALKDPISDAVNILPHHRIVLIEGLYTSLSILPWREAAELLDERWLLQVEIDEAKRRLIKRHVASGVAKDWNEALWRAQENDIPNGQLILENSLEPTKVIQSAEYLPTSVL